jgi:hypothetical protein
MAIQDDATLKTYFETGDFPSESNFVDLIDSKLVKTASSAIKIDSIFEETLDNGVRVENTIFQDNNIAQGATQTQGYVMRMYEIGTWNMNISAAGDALKTVVLDGALKFPESVNVIIINDSGAFGKSLEYNASGQISWDASGDIVMAANAGTFDTTDYDGATNRGFVVVTKWTTLV